LMCYVLFLNFFNQFFLGNLTLLLLFTNTLKKVDNMIRSTTFSNFLWWRYN